MLSEPADLLGQAEAVAVKVLIRVAAMLVNEGNSVPKDQSTGKHRGTPVRVGCWSHMQMAASSISQGSQPMGGHCTDQVPEGHYHVRYHHTDKHQLGLFGVGLEEEERAPRVTAPDHVLMHPKKI